MNAACSGWPWTHRYGHEVWGQGSRTSQGEQKQSTPGVRSLYHVYLSGMQHKHNHISSKTVIISQEHVQKRLSLVRNTFKLLFPGGLSRCMEILPAIRYPTRLSAAIARTSHTFLELLRCTLSKSTTGLLKKPSLVANPAQSEDKPGPRTAGATPTWPQRQIVEKLMRGHCTALRATAAARSEATPHPRQRCQHRQRRWPSDSSTKSTARRKP